MTYLCMRLHVAHPLILIARRHIEGVSLKERVTLTPKIFLSLAEYLSDGLLLRTGVAPVRPNRSVQTDPILGLHS